MPVCENQDLPVYREFSAEKKKIIRKLVSEEWYQVALPKSRYLRAYQVENRLKAISEEDFFWLLQACHFHDSENTFGDEEYYSTFRDAANSYLLLAKDEEKKLVHLISAYARIHLGSPKMAHSMLKPATQFETPDVSFCDNNLKAVKACVSTRAPKSAAQTTKWKSNLKNWKIAALVLWCFPPTLFHCISFVKRELTLVRPR